MNIREELQKAVNTGIPIAVIAKRIGKDPSTLNKFIHNVRNISPEVEADVAAELRRIKKEWENIM